LLWKSIPECWKYELDLQKNQEYRSIVRTSTAILINEKHTYYHVVRTEAAHDRKRGKKFLASGVPKPGSMTFLCRLWLFPIEHYRMIPLIWTGTTYVPSAYRRPRPLVSRLSSLRSRNFNHR
jgi:hypothetical protein